MKRLLVVTSVLATVPFTALAASAFTSLYDFVGGAGGSTPQAGISVNQSGIVYGVTTEGGTDACNCGIVFSFAPSKMKFLTLHKFSGGTNGVGGLAGVTPAGKDVIYGVTTTGGTKHVGSIYKIVPSSQKFTIVYSFKNYPDGADPMAGLTLSGNKLYGTTAGGGNGDEGTIFEFDPTAKTLAILHSFIGKDGSEPYSPLAADSTGALYGMTSVGGAHKFGTIFKFVPSTGLLTTLYSFEKIDGGNANPTASLAVDAAGVVYGTLFSGGPHGYGTVFAIEPGSNTLSVLHAFTNGLDGSYPDSGLVIAPNGKLYGTTSLGGSNTGTIFDILPDGGGFQSLYSFGSVDGGADGVEPLGGLAVQGGTVLGATGGTGTTPCACGTLFEYKTQ